MTGPDPCPRCGSTPAAGPPGGLCPRCLLGGVVDNGSASPTTGGVLETLAMTAGPMPRVLLRDTEDFNGPDPVVRPGSDEMPDDASRPGRLHLFGEIARGGMGAVLKGRDFDLGRDLAVKVLLEKHSDDPGLTRRFVEEAQIAGQLQHPGIVPVYELGTFADRRPYFAMKLVKGRTLAEVMADRAKPSDDHPRLLAIFLDIAQTMAYAHARGVIHRDLKPSNVMVGSFGEVQVMDWGLAKVLPRGGSTDDAKAGKLGAQETVIATARSQSADDQSLAGSVMGTPSYMAPEQARGEAVDERSDVFALGSILSEILTGRPAFNGRTAGEIQRKAARADTAEAVGRLDDSGSEAGLIAIARDCLAAEPEDRPAHAGTVADRLSAYLAGVQARVQAAERDRAVAQAQAIEERRRRKLQVGLAASVLALAGVGGFVAAYLYQDGQNRIARIERSIDETSTLLARARQDPEDPARWKEALAAARYLEEAGLAGPTLADRLARVQHEAKSGLLAAERDITLRQALLEIRADQTEDGPAASDARYAAAFREAGLDVDALGISESATRLGTRRAALIVELAGYLDSWAIERQAVGRPAESSNRPMAVARLADVDPYRTQVRTLMLRDDPEARSAGLKALADDPRAGELPPPTALLLGEALREPEGRVALLRKVVGRHPDDVWVNIRLAEALNQLNPAPREEVVRYYTAARAIRPETAHDLAHLLERMNRLDEAEAIFRDLVARRPGDAHELSCLAEILKEGGRADQARVIQDRAIAAAREAAARRPGDGTTQFNLGVALYRRGRYDEAVVAYREAARLNPDSATPRKNLGQSLGRLGRLDEAIAAYREAVRLEPHDAQAHANLGHDLSRRGKTDEAIVELREAVRLDPDHVDAHNNLGAYLYAVLRDYPAAEAEFREAIRLHPVYSTAHYNLGIALQGLGRRDESIAEFRQAIRFDPDSAEAHSRLAKALEELGQADEAIAEFRQVIRLEPGSAKAHYNLGLFLAHRDRPGEAIAEYREAIRLDPRWAEAHCNLGHVLRNRAESAEALEEFRRGHELGSMRPDWPYPSADWVRRAEREVALAPRLAGVLLGTDRPAGAAERLDFAGLCLTTKQHAAAARLCVEAFEDDPRLADDPANSHRYNAACHAALAGSGRSEDDPKPDAEARAQLRRRALEWLRADLAVHASAVKPGPPKEGEAARLDLGRWRVDPDLAGVRDAKALADLPEAERTGWQALWSEVDALLARANAGPAKP